jgi:hypothetical protein
MNPIEKLSEHPIRASGFRPPRWLEEWYIEKWVDWQESGIAKQGVVCRSANLDRLTHVLEYGIDVPLGVPLWVDSSIGKAWEYGGPLKLLMFFSNDKLQTSHRVVPLSTHPDELDLYRKEYQTIRRLEDRIYMSRLPENDSRVGTNYEIAYCRFPVGNPLDCLVALLVAVPSESLFETKTDLLRQRSI